MAWVPDLKKKNNCMGNCSTVRRGGASTPQFVLKGSEEGVRKLWEIFRNFGPTHVPVHDIDAYTCT